METRNQKAGKAKKQQQPRRQIKNPRGVQKKKPPPVEPPKVYFPKNVQERIMLHRELLRTTACGDLSCISEYLTNGGSVHTWRRLMRVLDPRKMFEDLHFFELAIESPQLAMEQLRFMLQNVPTVTSAMLIRFMEMNFDSCWDLEFEDSDLLGYWSEYNIVKLVPIVDVLMATLGRLGPITNKSIGSLIKRNVATYIFDVYDYAFRKDPSSLPRAKAILHTLTSLVPTDALGILHSLVKQMIGERMEVIPVRNQPSMIPLLKVVIDETKRHANDVQWNEFLHDVMRSLIYRVDNVEILTWFVKYTNIDINRVYTIQQKRMTYFKEAMTERRSRVDIGKALIKAGFTAFTIRPTPPTYHNGDHSNIENNANNNLYLIRKLPPTRTKAQLLQRLAKKHPHVSARMAAWR